MMAHFLTPHRLPGESAANYRGPAKCGAFQRKRGKAVGTAAGVAAVNRRRFLQFASVASLAAAGSSVIAPVPRLDLGDDGILCLKSSDVTWGSNYYNECFTIKKVRR